MDRLHRIVLADRLRLCVNYTASPLIELVRITQTMPQAIPPAGFIVSNGDNVICGTGNTRHTAWLDFKSEMQLARVKVVTDSTDTSNMDSFTLASDYRVLPASQSLLWSVLDHGGDIPWHTFGGVACTTDEAEDHGMIH